MAINELLQKIGPSLLTGAVAAVGGGNPLVGLLAGPFLGKAMENSRTRRELDNEKLREEILGSRQKRTAAEELGGLFASGGDPNARLGADQIMPEEMGPPRSRAGHPDPMSDPRVMGLLAKMSPDVFAQGLLSSMTRPERDPTTFEQKVGLWEAMVANGVYGSEEEAYKDLRQMTGMMGTPIDPTVRLLAQIDAREAVRAEREAVMQSEEQLLGRKAGLGESATRVNKLARTIANLSGSPLEPGLGATKAREGFAKVYAAISEFATGRRSDIRMDLRKLSDFRKDVANLVIDLAASANQNSGGSIGNLTNDKLNLFIESMANEDIPLETSLGILQSVAANYLLEEQMIQIRDPSFKLDDKTRAMLEVIANGEIKLDNNTFFSGGGAATQDIGPVDYPIPPGFEFEGNLNEQ